MSARNVSVPTIAEVSGEQWEQLAQQRIFFGHQSVGGNIIEGVHAVLAENQSIPLRVLEVADAAAMTEPGIYHSPVGRNGEPATKLAAFTQIVSVDSAPNTALLKYCYVDVTAETDPQALFEEYRVGVEALRAADPDLTIVHVTLPLLKDIGTLRYAAATVRGLPTGRDVNLIRHQYNALVRQTYGGKEPIFDLARLESQTADGGVAAVRYKGFTVPVLAPEWTNDGGHLNAAGRQRIAEAFLVTLANLYARVESAS